MSFTFTAARNDLIKVAYDAWTNAGYDADNLFYDDLNNKITSSNAPWARVTVRHDVGGQASLRGAFNTYRYRRIGTITIQIFTPNDTGLSLMDSIAKNIIDAFDGQTTENGIWFRNSTYREVGVDGDFFNALITTTFEYDEIK